MPVCSRCNGMGVVNGLGRSRCSGCAGTGRSGAGTCPYCGGSGASSLPDQEMCWTCHGSGYVNDSPSTNTGLIGNGKGRKSQAISKAKRPTRPWSKREKQASLAFGILGFVATGGYLYSATAMEIGPLLVSSLLAGIVAGRFFKQIVFLAVLLVIAAVLLHLAE